MAAGDEPDPRWSLANERTLLAYVRTGLALIVAGLAVSGTELVLEAPRAVQLIGLPLIALGTVVSASSHRRFEQVDRAMRAGTPLPKPPLRAALGWSVALVGVASVAVAVLARA